MTGRELRQRREALGLSQAEMHALLGLNGANPRQMVYQYETGRRRLGADVSAGARRLLDRWARFTPAELEAARSKLREKMGLRRRLT